MSRREWRCIHGVGHPDEDVRGVDSVHCCDGCCAVPITQRIGRDLIAAGESLKRAEDCFADLCDKEITNNHEESRAVRKFPTGASRDTDNGKPDYVGYLSPLSLKRFGEYMTLHRKQADGTMRGSDNWKFGIPKDAYVRSMARHFVDVWLHHEGHGNEATEDIESALCAVLFNAGGLLHEIIKERLKKAEG